MAVITQGRKQWIVSTKTLLGWKRFERESAACDPEIVGQDPDGALLVEACNGARSFSYRLHGRREEALD